MNRVYISPKQQCSRSCRWSKLSPLLPLLLLQQAPHPFLLSFLHTVLACIAIMSMAPVVNTVPVTVNAIPAANLVDEKRPLDEKTDVQQLENGYVVEDEKTGMHAAFASDCFGSFLS